MLNKEALKQALNYYPFGDDFGEPSDKILRDEIIIAGKDHINACHICGNDIELDTPHRTLVVKWGGTDMVQYRWCYDCCIAMLLYQIGDEGYAMNHRYSLRYDLPESSYTASKITDKLEYEDNKAIDVVELKNVMLDIPCADKITYMFVGSQETADALGFPEGGHWYRKGDTWELRQSLKGCASEIGFNHE